MTLNKRKPGRPRGSSLDDRRDLDAVADLLVREPGLKRTPAIKRIVQKNHVGQSHKWEAIERRLLRKWALTGEERLADARTRQEERRHKPSRPVPYYNPTFTSVLAEHGSAAQRTLETLGPLTGIATVAALMEQGSAVQRALEAVQPVSAQILGISSAVELAIAQFESSPVQQAIRRFEEDATRLQRMVDQVGLWSRF